MSPAAPDYVAPHGLLAGKKVLVTAAAGTGIGFAAAKKALEEGATVVISDKHERRCAESAAELGVVGVAADQPEAGQQAQGDGHPPTLTRTRPGPQVPSTGPGSAATAAPREGAAVAGGTRCLRPCRGSG